MNLARLFFQLFTLAVMGGMTMNAMAANFVTVTNDSTHGVIVPTEEGANFYANIYNVSKILGWQPTPSLVRDFEEKLTAQLRAKQDSRFETIIGRLPGYVRQYMGVMDKDQRILYVHFACDAPSDWESKIFLIDDGGDCYFELRYDVDRAAIIDYSINGDS